MDVQNLTVVGWREWLSLPELNIPHIKAKIDTGARTSALHAFCVEYFTDNHLPKVKFLMHPYQRKTSPVIQCIANLKDMRMVTDSGGHREERPVIETLFCISHRNTMLSWTIEITLTSRDDMNFKMLLGRTAMRHRLIVEPACSYLWGKKKIK